MREMIKQAILLDIRSFRETMNIYAGDMDAGGFGFAYKGGARSFTIRFETLIDIDRFVSDLLSIWGNVIGEYREAPALGAGKIIGYWNETRDPFSMTINRHAMSIMINSDHPDYPVYSFLEDLRRYVDPCAMLEGYEEIHDRDKQNIQWRLP